MADDKLEKKAFEEIQLAMLATLETYSNVHRGSGHNSQVTTRLFEHAREVVLDYLGLNKRKYVVIFCSSFRAEALKSILAPSAYRAISSRESDFHWVYRHLRLKEMPFLKISGFMQVVARPG